MPTGRKPLLLVGHLAAKVSLLLAGVHSRARPGPLAHSRNTHSHREARTRSRARNTRAAHGITGREPRIPRFGNFPFFFFFFSFLFKEFLSACASVLASPPWSSVSFSLLFSRANSSSSSSLFLVLALILSSSRPRHGVASNSRTPRRESCSCRRAHLLNYAHHPPSRRTIVGGAVQCGAVRYGTTRCGAVR